MGWFTTTVDADDHTITLDKGFSSQAMRWHDVERVYAEKVDKVTYEELFIILEDNVHRAITVGEMDQAFTRFEAMLQSKLKNFPLDWRASLGSEASGFREQVWCRN